MSVRRSLAWMMLSQGGQFVLQFGGMVVLARLLSPYEMGIYTAAMSVVGILSVFQAFGVTLFVIREPHYQPAVLRTAFTLNAILSLILAGLIAGLSTLGAAALREPGVERVMLLLAPIPLLTIPQFLPATLIERSGNFRAVALANLARVSIATVVTVLLAITGAGYISLAWGTLAGAAASSGTFVLIGRRHLDFRLGLHAWRHIATFCVQQFAIQGVNEIAGRLADFMLGRIVGLAGLGLYGRAVTLNNAIWSNVHVVVGRVVLIDFAEKHRVGQGLRDAYLRTLDFTSALLWPAFLGLAILAGPVVRFVYGDNWVAAGPLLSGLSLAAILLVCITMTWELFAVCQRSREQARLEVVRASVGTALFASGCFLGLTAAAFSRIADAGFSLLVYRRHVRDMTQTQFSDLVPIYLRNGMLTLVATCPALILMAASNWSPFVPILHVLSVAALGVVLWALTLRLTHHRLADEFNHVASRLPILSRFAT